MNTAVYLGPSDAGATVYASAEELQHGVYIPNGTIACGSACRCLCGEGRACSGEKLGAKSVCELCLGLFAAACG